MYFSLQILGRCILSTQIDIHNKPIAKPPKTISREAQSLGARLLRERCIRNLEVLSLDLLGNGLHALMHMGAVKKERRSGNSYKFHTLIKLIQLTGIFKYTTITCFVTF